MRRRKADREWKCQKRAAKHSWCLQSRQPTEFGLPEWIRTSKAQLVFVSAPECRDIETALYDRTSVRPYVFSVLCSIFQYAIKRWLRALQLSGSREHKSD